MIGNVRRMDVIAILWVLELRQSFVGDLFTGVNGINEARGELESAAKGERKLV